MGGISAIERENTGIEVGAAPGDGRACASEVHVNRRAKGGEPAAAASHAAAAQELDLPSTGTQSAGEVPIILKHSL